MVGQAILYDGAEGLIQVGDQVVGVLQANRQAKQVLRGSRLRAFDRSAVLDQAVRAAQAGSADEKPAAGGDVHGRFAVARHLEGEHAAECRHLACRDFVARVVRQAGVVHGFAPRRAF